MVVFDTNLLLMMLDSDAGVSTDPQTEAPVVRVKERIEYLIMSLSAQNETIGIPTPVLAEILTYAENAGSDYLGLLGANKHFRILAFDLRAAVECAVMTSEAIRAGDKKAGSTEPWQKVKVDRQIVAIGVVERASKIYSDDNGVIQLARGAGVEVVSSWQLPLPPENPQQSLPL